MADVDINHERNREALRIAITIGLVEECDDDEGCYFGLGVPQSDIAGLAEDFLGRNQLPDCFDSKTELVTALKGAQVDYGAIFDCQGSYCRSLVE